MRFSAPLILTLASSVCCFSQTNILTFHNDSSRSGQNLQEKLLTPANVNSAQFGKLYSVTMDGKVDAQPLYVAATAIAGGGTRAVVYAATEHDSVYAFDSVSGTVYWKVSLLGQGEVPSDSRGCNQVTPEIGVTATPVIDLNSGSHGAMYVIAMSKDAAGNYHQRLHALDISTGAEQSGSPVDIAASYPGAGDNSVQGSVQFDPKQYKSRPGMLLLNGIIYTGWGSHCDIRPYTGWLMGYSESTLAQTSVFNFAPNGSEAALWNSGGSFAADAQSNLYVSVANGTFDTTLTGTGFPSKGDLGNAFVKLSSTDNQLQLQDYWTMNNTVSESSVDEDLGSGGLMLLPDLTDASGVVRHLGTGAGKDGNVYVFDRDNLGKFDYSDNSTLYEEIPNGLGGAEFASPAWFNGTVYYGAVNEAIRAYQVTGAKLNFQPSSTTATAFGYPGVTPSISANGTSDGILWAVENTNPAVLHAYDATNLATELYNSNQAASARDQFGSGNKYITPTIADGRVFVGTTNSVAVFGLLNGGPIPDGDYMIVNQSSYLVLDDPAFATDSGRQIIQWSANGGNNQKWHFALQSGSFYTISNVSSGQFLTDPGSSFSPGIALEQQTQTNDASQLWSLTPSGSSFVIRNKGGNLVMDDPGFNSSLDTGIILWSANGGSNQSWTIQ